MFQSLAQGANLFILYKNEPRVEVGRVMAANTHLPQFNLNQPQAMLGGMVTDLSVSVGSETIPFAGLPATASVANFPDKGMFVSENQALVISELSSMCDNYQRIIDGYEPSKEGLTKCKQLILSLSPEKQKEAQAAQEMAELRDEISQLKSMLSAALETTKPKEK